MGLKGKENCCDYTKYLEEADCSNENYELIKQNEEKNREAMIEIRIIPKGVLQILQ